MTTPMPVETQLLLTAYVDGELDAASSLAFERRLADEPDLAAAHRNILVLKSRLREALPLDRAPDSLVVALERIGAAGTAGPKGASPAWLVWFRERASSITMPEWRMAFAACLVGMVAGAGVTALVGGSRPQAPVMAEVVSDHLRAVMAPQPFDVASSDQHTVKPWFTGRLPFAPKVFDLASAGFPLIGGRVDVLNGQPAAALAFRRGKHVISLLSQPIGPTPASVEAGPADRGFQVRHWTTGGMNYWAVSDVAPDELDAFEAAARGAVGGE